MAKYDITCGCGHVETVQIYGKASDREKEIARREKGVCKECWQAAQAEAAQETTQTFNLVQLEGSEKQISWAENIRAKIFDSVIFLKYNPNVIKHFGNKPFFLD